MANNLETMANNKDKIETFRERMYQRAINVYQYQGIKNSTWMHLYAIFDGAFFLAFYTVHKQITNTCPNVLLLIILIMGLLTSLCWLGSYHSYHLWLKNYVMILHIHENGLIEEYKKSKTTEEEKMDDIDCLRIQTIGFSKYLKDGCFAGLAGDKINKVFIGLVVSGWIILLLNFFNLLFPCAIILTIVFVIVFLILILILNHPLKSNGIDNMWSYNNDSKYEVCQPKKPIKVETTKKDK